MNNYSLRWISRAFFSSFYFLVIFLGGFQNNKFTTIKFPKLQQNVYLRIIIIFFSQKHFFLPGLYLFCFAVWSCADQETLRGGLDQIMTLRGGLDQNLVIQAILSNSTILTILRSIMRTFPSISIPPISQTLRSQ